MTTSNTDQILAADQARAEDVQTLWSPDATVTVTDDIDYYDLHDFAVSLYRHAVKVTRKDQDPAYSAIHTLTTWLALPAEKNAPDVFAATFVRLNPYILIGEITS
jgi:hypothetical protein